MSRDNGHEDDFETPPGISPIANPANGPLLSAVGNLVIEAVTHSAALKSIYDVIRTMTETATSSSFGRVLVTEYERHRDKTNVNLATLKTAAG